MNSISFAQLPTGDHGTKWELIPEFSDEFNSGTLDTSKWHLFKFMNDEFENGSGIDFISFDRYTWLNSFTTMDDPHRNVFFSEEDGEQCLELQIRSDNLEHFTDYLDPNYDTHTAGVVQSNRQFKYGFIEVRAKTAPTAVSSAFWLDSVKTNHHREIDVFELYGTSKAADQFGGCSELVQNRFLSNFILWNHCGGSDYFDTLGRDDYLDYFNVAERFPNDFPNGFDHTAEFHTYGLLWEENRMELYVDGVLVNIVDPTRVSELAQGLTDQFGNPAVYDWTYPMATLFTMEGFFFLRQDPCSEENGPANIADESYYIDYVRVWRRSIEDEIVCNPGFDSDADHWSASTSGDATASIAYLDSLVFDSSEFETHYSESADGVLAFNVSHSGDSRDDAVLRSAPFALESNSVYRASFALRSDLEDSTRDERFIKFAVVEVGNPDNVLFESAEYTDREWAEVNHTFAVGDLTGSEYEIQFQCGGSSFLHTCDLTQNPAVPGTGTFDNAVEFFFDFVTLGRVGPTDSPEGECNELSDSDFSGADHGAWCLNTYSPQSEATLSQENGTGLITITTPGNDFWEVSMNQTHVHLRRDSTYRLEFDAKANAAGKRVNVKVIQAESPWGTIFEEEVELSQESATYQLSFPNGDFAGKTTLDFQVGGQGAHEFEFDNISLQDVDCGVVTPPAPGAFGCDQVSNGDFSSGTDDWYLFEDVGNAAATLSEENGELKLDVSSTGTDFWQITATHIGLQLEPGHDYQLAFDARTEGISAIKVIIYAPDPYLEYFEHEVQPVSDFTSYVAEFSPEVSSAEEVFVTFQIGGQGVGTAYLDNVTFKKTCVESGSGENNANAEAPSAAPSNTFGCDQISNGDFADGKSDWYLNSGNEGSSANYRVAKGQLTVNIADGGSEPWHVGVVQVDRILKDGETYRLSFDARANRAADVNINIMELESPWNSALATSVIVDRKMATYSFEFNYEGGGSAPAFLEFQFGGGGKGRFKLDNVKLEQLNCE